MQLLRIDGSLIFETKGGLKHTLTEALRRKLDLTDLYLLKVNISGIDFTGASLYNAEFESCLMNGCNFKDANLRRARFSKCKADDAGFQEADLDSAIFQSSHFMGCDFSGTQVSRSELIDCFFTCCNFNRMRAYTLTVTDCRFRHCAMREIRISNTTRCNEVQLVDCDLRDSDIGRLTYTKSSHQHCVCDGLRCAGQAFTSKVRNLSEEQAIRWAKYFDKLRIERGWSMDYVADAIGANMGFVMGLAEGKSVTNLPRLIALCRLFNITLADIYYATISPVLQSESNDATGNGESYPSTMGRDILKEKIRTGRRG